jgi:hypothetical protein
MGAYGTTQACLDEMHIDVIMWVGCESTGAVDSDYEKCLPTLQNASAIAYVSANDPPYLQLVGKNDKFPVGGQLRFRDALIAAGGEARFEHIAGADHMVLGAMVGDPQGMQLLLDFLKTNDL